VRPLAFLTFLFVALLPALAFGQSITLGTQIDHSVDTDATSYDEIWYEECTTPGATVTIPVTLMGVDNDNVHIWVGRSVNCADNSTREMNVDEGNCVDIGVMEGNTTAELLVQDVLQVLTDEAIGSANYCSSIGQDTVTVYFLDMVSTTVTTSASTAFDVDFSGPSAPEIERVGVGENQLIVHWGSSSSADIDGYRLFCEPLAGGTPVDEEDGSAPEPPCVGTSLVPGERPPGSVKASKQYGVTKDSGAYDGLENGVWYACGVAGVDTQGNYGNLSELACGKPELVTDFYEAYVRAGGQGGGGFCAFSRTPHRSALAVVAVAALLLAARRRKGATQS
jgi:hypothetical protein